ncbi:MAG TPA: hypothetical protein VMY38_03790 [Gemmatimonadaceae bacterium]|nr:hypothetical protein [Gemmatimonadaceae bacterium]
MLRLSFERQHDGSVVFRCTRADATSTWQRHSAKSAMFFPFHDLTHFAVESTFGFSKGFYGLIAEGWDIADTSGKGARGRLPPEAILVEHMVGLFDTERVGGAPPLTADEFNKILADLASSGRIDSPPVVTAAQLQAVRARISELYERLAALQPGNALELSFEET